MLEIKSINLSQKLSNLPKNRRVVVTYTEKNRLYILKKCTNDFERPVL